MQLTNIVAFGDSFTYGWVLPDQDLNNTFTSKHAWPHVLSKKLSCTYNNMAVPGASNREIWHRLLNYKFKKHDVAVVLWTWINRYAIITGPNNEHIEQVSINTPIARRLDTALHVNNDFDRMYDSYTYIDHANRVLKERNITVYNFGVDALEDTPNWATATSMCNISFLNVWKNFPYTADYSHPGVEAHQEMAEIMFNFIHRSQL